MTPAPASSAHDCQDPGLSVLDSAKERVSRGRPTSGVTRHTSHKLLVVTGYIYSSDSSYLVQAEVTIYLWYYSLARTPSGPLGCSHYTGQLLEILGLHSSVSLLQDKVEETAEGKE